MEEESNIEKQPFRSYKLDEERTQAEKDTKVIPIRLNKEQYEQLQKVKPLLLQSKDSSAIKLLMEAGTYLIHRPESTFLLNVWNRNQKNNKRRGVADFDD